MARLPGAITYKPKGRMPLAATASIIYPYLLGYFQDNGFMPTLSEIATFIKQKTGIGVSRQMVVNYLREIEKQGKIKVAPGKLRGIILLKPNKKT